MVLIENINGFLSCDVYKNGKQYSQRKKLKSSIEETWHKIAPQNLDPFMLSIEIYVFDLNINIDY